MPATRKLCRGCGSRKLLTAFGIVASAPDGRRHKCKVCVRAIKKAWREALGDTHRANERTYAATRREKNRQLARDWRKKNRKKQAAATRKWKQLNHDAVITHNANRRARLKGAPGRMTAAEWRAKCAEYDHRCAYCKRAVPLTRHHVVPLARQGSNDIGNIVPACRHCNSTIGTKIIQPGTAMGHEKQGIIRPGMTPDVEAKQPAKTAAASSQREATKALDDDFSKRAADAVANRITPRK